MLFRSDPNNYQIENLSENNPFQHLVAKGKIIVGYAGSMGITNALESFIETIKQMDIFNNIYFLLVGSGDLKKTFENELSQYKNVTFLPRIKQNEVKYFLQICDILYLSTKDSKVWDYGQSMNKVVEYMLAAKPIIATYTGFPSMINEANCGNFVNSSKPEDLKNAILHYANMSSQERFKVGKNGRKWIFENRTYDLLGKRYLEVINKYKK